MNTIIYRGKLIVLTAEVERGEYEWHAAIRTLDGKRFAGRESHFRGVYCLTHAMEAVDKRIAQEAE
jgi:hypothetical protein